MNYTEKRIVQSYSALFKGLSSSAKIKLIENLSESLKEEKKMKDSKFFKSFGAFSSSKTAEEIRNDIRSSRTFRKKALKF